jgi:leader peptidase (prepilin peptidase)/N-methyltransferase
MLHDVIRILATVFAGLLGLAFGSFLNVCLSRWPQGESIVKPRSHCRSCGRVLAWWENIPLVSWVLLKGRCRSCGARIGWRYILVEAALGGLWAFAVWNSFPGAADALLPASLLWYRAWEVACTMALIWILVCLGALDAEHLWLPDWITWPGIGLGIALGLLRLPILIKLSARTGLPLAEEIESGRYGIYTPALELVLGAIGAAFLVLLIRWIYWITRRREGIGLGDAKLMALLAAWLGFAGALLAFGVGCSSAQGWR